MQSNDIDIAIINTTTRKVSTIFTYFCGKDSANRVKCKIKVSEMSFYFNFREAAYLMQG